MAKMIVNDKYPLGMNPKGGSTTNAEIPPYITAREYAEYMAEQEALSNENS